MLITCKACNHQISPKASTCPQCGNPTDARVDSGGRVIARIVFILFGVFCLWGAADGYMSGDESTYKSGLAAAFICFGLVLALAVVK